jgi:hypothetical protein
VCSITVVSEIVSHSGQSDHFRGLCQCDRAHPPFEHDVVGNGKWAGKVLIRPHSVGHRGER